MIDNNMPQISVITPVYNGITYIDECIKSLLNQTYRDIEFLFIDAGSTDGTFERLKNYADEDSRVRLIHSDMKSMGHQYNIGLDEAKGRYIGFAEADDVVPSDAYDILLHTMIEKDVDYAKGDFDMFTDTAAGRIFLSKKQYGGEKRKLYGQVISPSEHPEILFNDANMWRGLYKREFIEKNRIRLNETPGAAFQDMGFVQQAIIYASKAVYINHTVYLYRRDNVYSSTFMPKGIKFVYDEFKYLDGLFNSIDRYSKFRKNCYLRFFRMFFAQYEKLPTKEQREYFIDETVKEYLRLLEIAEEEGILELSVCGSYQWKLYKLALFDFEAFDIYCIKMVECVQHIYKSYLQKISEKENIILFGAGDMGNRVYSFLKINGIENIKAFCDNNKAGEQTNGLKIKSLNQCIDEYKGAFYIICIENKDIASSIRDQLISQSINADNIQTFPLDIDHYTATTIYTGENENE